MELQNPATSPVQAACCRTPNPGLGIALQSHRHVRPVHAQDRAGAHARQRPRPRRVAKKGLLRAP